MAASGDLSPGRADPRHRAVGRGDRLFHALAALGIAAGLAWSLRPVDPGVFPPTFSVPGPGERSVCMLRRVTGIPCPTCGVTRSFHALGRGRVGAALAFHPLGPVYLAMLVVVAVRSAGIALTGRRWLERAARALLWSLPAVALATLAVYAVRLAVFFAEGTGAAAWRVSPLGRLVAALAGG